MNDLVKIENKNGKLWVSCRVIAEHFEKQHQHVTQAVEKIISENSLVKKMFSAAQYKPEYGQTYKEHLMDRYRDTQVYFKTVVTQKGLNFIHSIMELNHE